MEIPFTESIRHGLTQCHALLAWRWPGNIRELRNMMERGAFSVDRANAGQARIYAAVITWAYG